jgi:hypothetical protein
MTLLYKALAVAALIAAVIFGYKAWEHHIDQQGYARANGEWELKEAQIKADAAQKLADATVAARAKEQALNRSLLTETEKRLMENAAHEKTIAGLNTAIRTRDLRLSIAIDPRSLPGCATASDSTPSGGPGTEARAGVMPETAVDILGIAGDIAKNVRDYNAVVDAYNRARAVCNDKLADPAP